MAAGGLKHMLVRLTATGGVEGWASHYIAVGGEAHDHLALVAAGRVDDAHTVDHRGHPGDEEASCSTEVQRVLRPRDVGDDHVDADGPSDPVEQPDDRALRRTRERTRECLRPLH